MGHPRRAHTSGGTLPYGRHPPRGHASMRDTVPRAARVPSRGVPPYGPQVFRARPLEACLRTRYQCRTRRAYILEAGLHTASQCRVPSGALPPYGISLTVLCAGRVHPAGPVPPCVCHSLRGLPPVRSLQMAAPSRWRHAFLYTLACL